MEIFDTIYEFSLMLIIIFPVVPGATILLLRLAFTDISLFVTVVANLLHASKF